jgi:hypothetical protein
MKIGEGSGGAGGGAATGRGLTSTGEGGGATRGCDGVDFSSRTDSSGPEDDIGDEASARALDPAAARRFTTVGRIRSSTVLGDLAFSKCRFTRSTTSGPIALM